MKEAGYMLDTHCLLHEVDELHKEWAICHHSKKLAIAFGLISTAAGTPLHIFKNLLVCNDCHTVTKVISKMAG
jgi:hypothetical protein